MGRFCVIGLDYGTDSARAVLVDASDGRVLAQSVSEYPRWAKRMYCNPSLNEYRQHPLDYIESLKAVLHGVLDPHKELLPYIRAIGVDTTGSTPCLVDRNLLPLCLLPQHRDNPDAMFVLWKDHSDASEAEQITALAGEHLPATGGKCSPESFWPRLLHALRSSVQLKEDAYTFVDLCTWLPNYLCGNTDPDKVKHSQSVVGAKFFQDPATGQLPPREWFASIDEDWMDIVDRIRPGGEGCDSAYGTISPSLAAEFGLGEDVVVGVGLLDGFSGAIGAGISQKRSVMTLGTSSGYYTVSPELTVVPGCLAYGFGLILPGTYTVEMGLSAFGDAYAWLADLLGYALELKGIEYSREEILSSLGKDAEKIMWSEDLPYATDYFNGRRSPDADLSLRATLGGLCLHTSAPEIYRALVEATCFATRAFIERMAEFGQRPQEVICYGGISRKSPFVMQMLSDITGLRMKVVGSAQTCALGSAMCAAVACGIYPSIPAAQKAMAPGIREEYVPSAEHKDLIDKRYLKYSSL